MRLGYTIAIAATVVFCGGYFYHVAESAVCAVPIVYRLGELDDRFGLSKEEAIEAATAAEKVWEEAVGRDLFRYDPEARFTLNFIYDERQALTDAEAAERGRLEDTESASSAVQAVYDELIKKYNDLGRQHKTDVKTYEKDIAQYNEKVSRYNEQGGAPPEVYEQLEQEGIRLAAKQEDIQDSVKELNRLVDEINHLGKQGNQLIDVYNQGVDYFNDTFSAHREFTQGTYRNDGRIDVYTFTDLAELRLVLAHEFGHALSIEHVPDTTSIMYFMMGGQSRELQLSDNDMAALESVCEERSVWDTMVLGFNLVFNV